MGIGNVFPQRSAVTLRIVAAIASLIWAGMVIPNGGFARMSVRTIASGPVGYWPFNEGNGATVTDSSGNGNTGILVGAPVWMSGGDCKGGTCLRFNGSISHVEVPHSVSLTTSTAFTVTLWYKSTTNAGSIAAKPLGSGWLNSWQLEFQNGNLSFTSSDGSTPAFDTVAAPAAGNWVFVSATWDGDTKKLYLDGAQKIAASRSIAFDTSNIVFGGDYNAGTFVQPYSGVIDEVRVYNHALTASEIWDLYHASGPGGDSVDPSVILTAPSAGTAVSDTNVMITADASDNVAVTGVQFKLDGVDLGAEVTTAPYSLAWNATRAANGPHSLSAVARDAAGNIAVSRTMVNVDNLSGGTFEEIPVATTGLGTLTSMEFAPDGRLFVAEQAGRLRVIKNGSLLPVPFVTLAVTSNNERGLLGIAFHPNFAANRHIYLFYTRANSPVMHRVSRFTASLVNPDVAEPGSEVVILDNIPSESGDHNGGAIHFGLDGKLYVAVGDGGGPDTTKAQRLDTLSGKLLRINADGSIPSDNPFVGSAGARGEIWSLGVRNPFTFAVDPQSGKIHVNDVGNASWEEINLAAKGANYGWPTCEGFCTDSRFVNPIYAYSHAVGHAITGGAFYRATQFPAEFWGSYFFADYVGRWIKRLDANNQVLDFLSLNGGTPVDLKVGPDGSLYYLVLSGSVFRIRYNPGSNNKTPTASFTVAPASGTAPLLVNLDATGSTDPDGDTLTYSWNFGDGAPSATGVTVSHVYQNQGTYTATLTVDDGRGGTARTTRQIAVGSTPVAQIITPPAGTLYSGGATVNFSGSGLDAEDGTVPASGFSWTIVFHHDTHIHPFLGPINGVQSGTFQIPQSGETSANTFYRIHLTVTDSTGLTNEVTRDIVPRKVTLTLASNIAGLSLTLDGQPAVVPLTVQGVVGIHRNLGAPSPQNVNGKSYAFVSWSDGGTQTHTITTPGTNTIYTATYREIPPPQAAVPVTWTSLVNATVTGSVLRKTGACDGCANSGAISQQTITFGDGYVEFTVAETGPQRLIGLSNGNPGTTAGEIKFALNHSGPYMEVRESGVYKTDRPYAVGDVFRIAVLAGRVTYSKNGTVFYISSAIPAYPLLVDTALLGVNASLGNVVILTASITPPPPPSSLPVISNVNASPAATSATISWNTNVSSSSQVEYGTTIAYGSSTTLNTTPGTAHSHTIGGLLPNTLYHYRVRSGNALGVTISADFTFTTASSSAAVPVTWTSLVNVTVTGSVLRKTGACDGCANSGAISQQTITFGDGYVEFTVAETGPQRLIGLSNGNPGTTAGEIKFALNHSGPYMEVRESGVYKTDRPYAVGDVFRIAVLAGRVTYSKNGTVFYISSAIPAYPLLVDTALLGVNASLSNVVILTGSIMPPPPPSSLPVISNVNASPAATSATISWNTNVSSSSQVEYGTTIAYGSSTTLNTTPGTAHSHTIGGLLPNTLYHYRVRSGNARGVTISVDFTFTTASSSAAVPVTWTSLVNATVTGSVLRKTGACDGCANSGAISQQTITFGDGYVEFTVAETGPQRLIGLSNGNPGTTAGEIKFALNHSGPYMEVRESGVYKTDRPYAVGDIFRIAVVGGRVTYSKNGTVFYISSAIPAYPLLVDTALLGVNASLSNVVILTGSITASSPPAISNVNASAAEIASASTISQ